MKTIIINVFFYLYTANRNRGSRHDIFFLVNRYISSYWAGVGVNQDKVRLSKENQKSE